MKAKTGSWADIIISAAAIALIAVTLEHRLNWLLIKDYPNATDSFYYLQEFKNRLLHGQGYYIKHSLFFSFWTFTAQIFGISALGLYNVIFLASLGIFSAAILIWLRGKFFTWLPYVLIYFYLASDLLFYRHYAFLKQGFSISILLFGLALIVSSSDKRPLRQIAGLCLIIAAGLMHIFTASIAFVFLLFLAGGKFTQEKLLSAAFLCCALVAAMYLFNDSRQVMVITDISSAGWWGTCESLPCSVYETREFQIYSFMFLAFLLSALFINKQGHGRIFYAALLLCIILNLPIWTPEGDMLNRMAASSVWIFFICLIEAARLSGAFERAIFLAALCLSILCFNMEPRLPYKANRLPFKVLEANKNLIKGWIPEGSFILAEHGLEFAMTYFLDRKAAASLPKTDIIKNYYQVRYNVSDFEGYHECTPVNKLATNLQAECVSLDSKVSILRLSGRI